MTGKVATRRSKAEPVYATRRRPDRETLGGRWAKIAEVLGTPFMPWQRQVADVLGEIDPDTGLLAYRTGVFTVMRQSGKTTLVLPIEVDRGVAWSQPQRVVYTAQTGLDARKKLFEDQLPVLEASPLGKGLRVVRAAGQESIKFPGGSRIDLTATGKASGHGGTLDVGVIDEAFHDVDDRREQAMVPAMATRPWAQLLITSTKGTAESLYLRRKFDDGRAAAEADRGSGIAYFEWAVPMDADIASPDVWWQHMPALGWTIPQSAVQHAFDNMAEAEFRRAFCNQWTEHEADRVIPVDVWDRVCSPTAAPSGPLTWAVDVREDRSAGAVASAAGGAVELVDRDGGTGWIEDRVVDLVGRHGGRVLVDGRGPAASIGDGIAARGVQVDKLSTDDCTAACAGFYDSVADGTVKVRRDGRLDEAVSGLAKRTFGDRFVWSRSGSTTDIAPVWAVTLAWWGSSQESGPPDIW